MFLLVWPTANRPNPVTISIEFVGKVGLIFFMSFSGVSLRCPSKRSSSVAELRGHFSAHLIEKSAGRLFRQTHNKPIVQPENRQIANSQLNLNFRIPSKFPVSGASQAVSYVS